MFITLIQQEIDFMNITLEKPKLHLYHPLSCDFFVDDGVCRKKDVSE